MCGRFGFTPDTDKWYEEFEVINKLDAKLEPHYNITPGQMVPIITKNSPKKTALMRWGFIPQWCKDLTKIKPQINARADGIQLKPYFRLSFQKFRCLIPASHFFEWKSLSQDKIPFCIKLKNRDMFAMAGLYSEIKDAEGYPIKTFTIITTTPNKIMEPIHQRMPVILEKNNEDIWLDEKTETNELIQLLVPYDDKKMEAYSVCRPLRARRRSADSRPHRRRRRLRRGPAGAR